jgi:chitin synthase
MLNNERAGGVCGEIEVDLEGIDGLVSSSYFVGVAQYYEYKLGHTPDKAAESYFGFTSVLPGAYSMFRWKAIKGTPLDTFFKNVNSTDAPGCAAANEYLAEDRIMCLQVYIKKNDGYTVTYIPDAKAFTDAPPSLMVLMK